MCRVTLLASVSCEMGMDVTSALWGPEVRARCLCVEDPLVPAREGSEMPPPQVPQARISRCFLAMEVAGGSPGPGLHGHTEALESGD